MILELKSRLNGIIKQTGSVTKEEILEQCEIHKARTLDKQVHLLIDSIVLKIAEQEDNGGIDEDDIMNFIDACASEYEMPEYAEWQNAFNAF